MTPTNYLGELSYYTTDETLALISELKSDDLQAIMDTGASGWAKPEKEFLVVSVVVNLKNGSI